jgi:small conductance mechanosensitive channel
MNQSQINGWILQIQQLGTTVGANALVAIVIFLVGRWAVNFLHRMVRRVMLKAELDPTLISFVTNSIYYVGWIMLGIAIMTQLGIQTTSLVAMIGAAGISIGLALQGALANVAAGLLLIAFRPFRVGDWIEGAGVSGIVEEIQLLTTIMRGPDNKTVIIPNGTLMAGNITNNSAKGMLRVDMVVKVAPYSDVNKVKTLIDKILQDQPLVLSSPDPTIGVLNWTERSIDFAVRPWTRPENYANVHFQVQENLRKIFDQEEIKVPLL